MFQLHVIYDLAVVEVHTSDYCSTGSNSKAAADMLLSPTEYEPVFVIEVILLFCTFSAYLFVVPLVYCLSLF